MKRQKASDVGTVAAAPVEALSVAAGTLTDDYADNVGSWINTQDTDNSGYADTSAFDLVTLHLKTFLASGVKLAKIRMALTNDVTPADIDYYTEDGQIKEWEIDLDDVGQPIEIATLKIWAQKFRIEAKMVDGTVGGIEELDIYYTVAMDNAKVGLDVEVHQRTSPYSVLLREYAALPAAGAYSARTSINTKGKKFVQINVYYAEGAGSSGGKMEAEFRGVHTHNSIDYPTQDTVAKFPSVSGTATLTTPLRKTNYEFEHANYEVVITGGSWAAQVATIVTGGHTLRVGDKATIRGVAEVGYNNDFVEVLSVTATDFTFALAADPGAWGSGGIARLVDFVSILWDNALRYNKLEVAVKETGDTTNFGDCLVFAKGAEA